MKRSKFARRLLAVCAITSSSGCSSLDPSMSEAEATRRSEAAIAGGLFRETASHTSSQLHNGKVGAALVVVGDVNGDGFDDAVAGTNWYSSDSNFHAVLLFKGGKNGLGAPSATPFKSASALTTVYRVGDVNGDGYADVAFGTATGPSWQLFFGSPSGFSAVPAWTLTFDVNLTGIVGLGDINHDGRGDVAIYGTLGFGADVHPTVKIYPGTATGLGDTPIWDFDDSHPMQFATGIAPIGDVNGDGYADVALYNTNCDTQGSRFYVFAGGPTGLGRDPLFFRKGPAPCSGFGDQTQMAGDVNGDGYADILTTIPQQLIVYDGNASGADATASWAGPLGASSSWYAHQVLLIGDADGDGLGDLAASEPYYIRSSPSGNFQDGRVHAFPSSKDGPKASSSWFENDTGQGNYAISIAAGDIDGDGLADLLVGDDGCWSTTTSNDGCIYVYYGAGGGAGPAIWSITASSDEATPAVLSGGHLSQADRVRIAALARGPYGRIRAKLEVEVLPFDKPFTGSVRSAGTTWQDTGLTGSSVGVTVTGLKSDSHYHYRARLLYSPEYLVPVNRSAWSLGDDFWTACSASDPDFDRDGTCDDEDPDDDGDGTDDALDCAPKNAAVHPGAVELIGDGVDQDCDGADSISCHLDGDRDGYGSRDLVVSSSGKCNGSGMSSNADDCNDAEVSIHPQAVEIPGDGIDQDCTGADLALPVASDAGAGGSDADGASAEIPGAGAPPSSAGAAGSPSLGGNSAGGSVTSPQPSGGAPSMMPPSGDGGAPSGASNRTPSAAEPGGCSCSAARSSSSDGYGVLLFFPALALLRRRLCRSAPRLVTKPSSLAGVTKGRSSLTAPRVRGGSALTAPRVRSPFGPGAYSPVKRASRA